MRHATFIALVACAMFVGCDPMARESVTLRLPSAAEADTAGSAVELIAEVMTTNGFTRTQASSYSNQTIVASFTGPGRLGCLVFHRTGQVQVVMQEMGRLRSRPEAIKTRDDLKRRLSERVGKDNVSQ